MQVLMVCPSYPPRDGTCGVGDYTRRLTEALDREGVGVSVVCSTGYRGDAGDGVRVLPTVRRWTAREAFRVGRAAETHGCGVVHVQYAPALYPDGAFWVAPLLLRLFARSTTRSVVTFHTLTGARLMSRLAALALLGTASHAISANEEVTAMIRRRVPRLAGRVTEIPIGANVEPAAAPATDRGAILRRLGVPASERLIVHFGLVYPGKGLETLLAAFAQLRRHDRALHLVIAGDVRSEDVRYQSGLAAVATALGLDGAVTWTGRCSAEEIAAVLHVADLYVVPYDDGASIRRGSLVAGLAHGVPVVTTTPRLPSAYVVDGEGLALVPPRDPGALAARMADLLRSPEQACALAARGRALAGRFDWTAIARATIAVYEGTSAS